MSKLEPIEWKRARVSSKRQITIPQKFYEQLKIQDEVEIGVKDQMLVLRPMRERRDGDDYADLILADLLDEGYTDKEDLLRKFRERQTMLRGAVGYLIAESREAAQHYKAGTDETAELFGDVDEQ
ncbi:AbrB/MazE/SpoVT family DNA-binding domain-containing protein [Saccharibacillus sp. CPCC 101409]|uniref:AbrB/MazE/SpoVT family DNA-binding domain-containing protein n=1 Tax=Saccharibacillus sp. CPCC 101409 TaxID=3058041 RepID=UPI002673E38F|nr:AbrB/MazE/SpoVT family DNA-binding domain-containing protein [Saccharibacillus sp. CPCC 101409]MDO3408398.1 AbrB/MazE/SpoVT family DNA-binding domain-containing protein [Saccharibacillus sp. CPCC 101409]